MKPLPNHHHYHHPVKAAAVVPQIEDVLSFKEIHKESEKTREVNSFSYSSHYIMHSPKKRKLTDMHLATYITSFTCYYYYYTNVSIIIHIESHSSLQKMGEYPSFFSGVSVGLLYAC